MGKLSKLDGWDGYLESLPPDSSNVYVYDYPAYNEQIANDTDRLFVEEPRVCVKVFEIGGSGKCFHHKVVWDRTIM
jgi:hypothetical protein